MQQPATFFDTRLADRAVMEHATLGADELGAIFRRRRYKVRVERSADGATTWVYGDRNQYFKMATLLTHLGLILFLAGGAVTAAAGFETIVFVAEGQTAPVRPVGTPDNLLVKNIDFEAPRNANGGFADFYTDLAVYQNGEQVARKTIRVNDPLIVDGFRIHQNTFGPAADLEIRDPRGELVWTGPIILGGFFADTFPQGFITIPGSDIGLLVLLSQAIRRHRHARAPGHRPGRRERRGDDRRSRPWRWASGGTSDPAATDGYSITWLKSSAWTGLVIKNDPGEGMIWIAFACLISGLALTFYFPRRRIWARFADDRVGFAMLGDRYVDVPKEFRTVLEEVAVRAGARAASRRRPRGADRNRPETSAFRAPDFPFPVPNRNRPLRHTPPHARANGWSGRAPREQPLQESHDRTFDGDRRHRKSQGRFHAELPGARRPGDLRPVRVR